MVKHYFEGTKITALCQIRNSLYLVGGRDTLFIWDRQEEKRLKYISTDYICSIFSLPNTSLYLVKTDGFIKILSLKEGGQKAEQTDLFEAKEHWNMTHSMDVRLMDSVV